MMGVNWSQSLFAKSTFTEADVGPQHGKVFLVTGGTSGIGLMLSTMLYRKCGRVWITGRSLEEGKKAMDAIRKAAVPTGGDIGFLVLQLDDLRSVRAAAYNFLAIESHLDVLWNNAGVFHPPAGSSVSAQGFEVQLATNCFGPYLFTQILILVLVRTEFLRPPRSVRVIWSCDQGPELLSPLHGIIMDEIRSPPTDGMRNYVNSKTGNMFLASEFARCLSGTYGIVSASVDPGAASTNLFRHTRVFKHLAWAALPRVERAACTLLYAGLSEDIPIAKSGCHIVTGPKVEEDLRPDLVEAMKSKRDGGTGKAREFYNFCWVTTGPYRLRPLSLYLRR
ncbi:hypothetical protein GGR53DRAFT_495300 [Hypoxylon sp. FL1150]|nr:hypothetical protein GGR53DRAFT_495300 [Hypoxylon sp. FL1150]